MYSNGGSPDAIAGAMSSPLFSPAFRHSSGDDFAAIKALISSDPYPDSEPHKHNHRRNQNLNRREDVDGRTESSLTRYLSAPTSFFANLLNDDDSDVDGFLDPVQEPEQRFFARQHKSEADSCGFMQYRPSSTGMMLDSRESAVPKQSLPPPPSTAMYGGGSRRVQNFPSGDNNNTDNSHINLNISVNSLTSGVMNSTNSNLMRQSSSPAGFLSSLNAENGFANDASRLNHLISFSPEPSSSPMLLSRISENGNHTNDSTYNRLKRTRNDDFKMFSNSAASDTQNEACGHYTPGLVHRMSLPNTSLEMAAAEKILRFEPKTVPYKLRAKRGHATHPRSIAERLRRTRISERMRKLQELFPNMDKQTSIADMLDMAVKFIKDLQKEVKTLDDARATCVCPSKQLRSSPTTDSLALGEEHESRSFSK